MRGPGLRRGLFRSETLRSREPYGVGSLSSTVRVLVSHGPVDPPTPELVVGVNTAFHEIVTGESDWSKVTVVASTLPFVVLRVAGDVAFVSVMSGSSYSTVPVQSLLSYILKSSVPLSAVPLADVIVALSFGRQTWSLTIELVS